MNQVQIIGNAAKTPEKQTFENGTQVAIVNVCTNKSYKKEDGTWHNEPTWHRVVLWGKLADTLINKGNKVLVIGELTYRHWEDNDKIKKTVAEITARTIEVIVRRENETAVPMPSAPYETHPVN